jgi:ABC-type uncharacterized transport system ATPase subunit
VGLILTGTPETHVSQAPPLVLLSDISKSFGPIQANSGISFSLNEGEVHALVGENGAGKTTLMRILYGMLRPDAGSIHVAGELASFSSPRDALALGIVMVQQNFALVEDFTVAENVVLGNEPTHARVVFDLRSAADQVSNLARRLGVGIDPMAKVRQLSAGMRQRVEILKVLYRGAKVLILDEPTSLLGPQEAEELFSIMRELARAGTGVVFISHRVPEVIEVSDRITVLRKGRKVAEISVKDTNPEKLSVLMAGGKTTPPVAKAGRRTPHPVLKLDHVSAHGTGGVPALTDVSLEVSSGEILGLAAVAGNGARELVEVVVGLRPLSGGAVSFRGRPVKPRAGELRRNGMSFIPEAPSWAAVGDLPLEENLLLGRETEWPFSQCGLLRRRAVTERCREILKTFAIEPAEPRFPAGALSGGNRQRLVVGRELDRSPVLVVAAHPTKGLDVAGAEFVRNRLVEERNRGGAVLLVSSDLGEILRLGDRIVVLFRGRVTASLENEGLSESIIIPYMTGARTQQAPGAERVTASDSQEEGELGTD